MARTINCVREKSNIWHGSTRSSPPLAEMSLPHEHVDFLAMAYANAGCSISVRPVTADNYDKLCTQTVGKKYKHRVVPVSMMLVAAHFRPSYRVLALYNIMTNAAVGMIAYERLLDDTLQLHIISIFAYHQSHGYGTAALKFVRHLAGMLGAKYVRALVDNDQQLLQFYAKRGFVRQIMPPHHFIEGNCVAMVADALHAPADDADSDSSSSDSDASSLPSTPTCAGDDAASASPRAKRQFSETD